MSANRGKRARCGNRLSAVADAVMDECSAARERNIARFESRYPAPLPRDPLSSWGHAERVLQEALADCPIDSVPRNIGRIYSMDTLDEQRIIRHCSSYVGQKDVQCLKCSAYMFGGECCNQNEVNKGARHRFKMCCGDGQICVAKGAAVDEAFEQIVVNDLGNKLPLLNSMVAFAGVHHYKAECPGEMYSFKILGHFHRIICQNLSASKSFAGIYILDAEEQIRIRQGMQSHVAADDQFSEAQLRAVTAYLLDVNPYAITLKIGAANQQVPIEILSGAMYTMRKPASQGGEVAALFPGDGISRPHFGIATLSGNSIKDANPIRLSFSNQHDGAATQSIPYDHGSYDALRFPILFPTGVYGWNRAFKRSSGDMTRRVSLREYYSYMLQDRPFPNNLLMSGRRLLQEYIVDAGSKIEDSEIGFQQNNQAKLRADSYSSIRDAKCAGFVGTMGRLFSKPQVMSKTIRGCPAQKRAKYKDFMAAFLFHGGVDAFVTMTANPDWLEVQSALKPGFSPKDRSDIVDKVFKLKLDILIHQINCGILGANLCVGYVIEFQKRGLPHAHIAISFTQSSKLCSGNDIDLMVSAEIPDPKMSPVLHGMVLKHNIHFCRCEEGNPASCVIDGTCKKHFPYELREYTILVDGEYPLYRRRNRHATEVVKGGRTVTVTDSMVVPYNPALTLLLDCHCNVQSCSQIFDFKYMFKYFTKEAEALIFYPHDPEKTELKRMQYAQDVASLHPADEINSYKVGRFLQTSECLWSIFSMELYYLSQPVEALPIHLMDEQDVLIRDGAVDRMAERTKLTAFFELNEREGNDSLVLFPTKKIKDLLYIDVPQHCVWVSSSRIWMQRVRKCKIVQIGRVNMPYDAQKELWALRLLLMNVPGPTSFSHLLNGAPTFIEAATNFGLLADNTEYKRFMLEVISIESPAACRRIFADLLVSVMVPHAVELWDCISAFLSQDFAHTHKSDCNVSIQTCARHALWCISSIMVQHDSTLEQFGFQPDSYCRSAVLDGGILRNHKSSSIACSNVDYHAGMLDSLKNDQLQFIKSLQQYTDQRTPTCMLLQAPGGTGKTHTLNVAIAMMVNAGLKVAVTSSTGISASALLGGRTVHSAFNAGIVIPIAGGSFSISAQSLRAKEWRSINILIIDEVMCLHRRFIDAISHTFHNNIFVDDADRCSMGPFCGITVIVSGDPRQQLPISPGANRQTLSSIGFHSSEFFPLFEKFHLTENVRIHPSVHINHVNGTVQPLQQWILNVGDGVCQANDIVVDGRCFVSIPSQFYCGDQVDVLLESIYCRDDHGLLSANSDYLAQRVILTPLYKDVQMINNKMLELYKQQGHDMSRVISHDTITGKFGDIEDANNYSASLFPEHTLQLFIGCPSISMYRLGLRCLTGRSAGKVIHLPRMLFTPSSKSLKIQMTRLQFGVVVAFGITVSKSQSCGFNNVGVWLSDHFFAHGHLYLALSRLQVKQDGVFKLQFASRQNFMVDDRGVFAINTVYEDILAAYK